MASKIEILSPMIEITNHFDSLINRIDIDIEQCLEKYNEKQVLSSLNCFDKGKRFVRGQNRIYLNCHSEKDIEYETVDEWQESTKVVDYLNRIRMRTIEELRKSQDETLEYYKLNSSKFKLNSMDEIRSELFKDKFHFQVIYKPEDPKYANLCVFNFNLFTFVTNFKIFSADINLLE